jgi:hypothetical protein
MVCVRIKQATDVKCLFQYLVHSSYPVNSRLYYHHHDYLIIINIISIIFNYELNVYFRQWTPKFWNYFENFKINDAFINDKDLSLFHSPNILIYYHNNQPVCHVQANRSCKSVILKGRTSMPRQEPLSI